jgi:hypothetical protein
MHSFVSSIFLSLSIFLFLHLPPLCSPPGHLSAQRAALQVQRCGKAFSESVAPFIEELVVRRELTDNYCFYNDNYDNIKGE